MVKELKKKVNVKSRIMSGPFKMKGFAYQQPKKEPSSFNQATDYFTKHNLYKSKKLSLKSSLNIGEGTKFGWNPKGGLTSFGSPTINFKSKANISAAYKIGNKATLSGNVEYATKQKPRYTFGLNINI